MDRIVYFDCFSGASGDMILGALVDAGLPLSRLKKNLACLPLKNFRISARKVLRAGFRATKVSVTVTGKREPARGIREIREMVRKSALDPVLQERVLEIFRRLAHAEGWAHGKKPEEVHFHEIGAVDSIVDVVGAVAGLREMNIREIVSSPLPMGSGAVRGVHGALPVPAPATAWLMKGFPATSSAFSGELVTPTGAALLTTLASRFGSFPSMEVMEVGCGAGSHDMKGCPNILRIFIGRRLSQALEDETWVLEANLDDLSGEVSGYAMDRLFEAGALDVFFVPVQMKKNRPGILLTVLVKEDCREKVEEVILRETTTLGLRRQLVQRRILERREIPFQSPLGCVRMKVAGKENEVLNVLPEYEDCCRIAAEKNLPLKEVFWAVLAAYKKEQAMGDGAAR